MQDTRTCTKCGATHPATREYFHAKGQGRLTAACKACRRARELDRYHDNSDAINAKARERHWRDRENQLAKSKKYREDNKDKIKAKRDRDRQERGDEIRQKEAERRAKNRERLRAQARQRYRDDPSDAKLRSSIRRARKKQNGIWRVSKEEMRVIHSRPCMHLMYGKCDGPIEVDHVVPIARGGGHRVGNLQPLCRSHNHYKSDRLEVEVRHEYLRNFAATA